MLKKLIILFIILFQFAWAKNNQEFRAVWVITWEYINPDWSASQNKAKIRQILDNVKKANMNAVLWQVRQSGTAYYPSSYEPWGYYANYHNDPGFDPLKYAIEEAHKRGLELHAWFNVYHVASTWPGTPAAEHPAWICTNEDGQFMTAHRCVSPGLDEVRAYTIQVAMEIVRNYDIDGLHLDFVRWNEYTEDDMKNAPSMMEQVNEMDGMEPEQRLQLLKTEGSKRYIYDVEHPASGGVPAGFDTWGDWRRWGVTEFVRQLHDSIQAVKPYVRLSPAALGKYNWSGWNGYYVVFQDAALWFNKGYIEQLTPMHYHWTTADGFYGMLKGSCPSCWEQWITEGINAKRLYTVGPGSYVLDDYNAWNNHPDIVKKSRTVSWVDGFQFFSYGTWAKHDYFADAAKLFFQNKTKIRPIDPQITPKPESPGLTVTKTDSLNYTINVTPPNGLSENQWFIIYRSDDAQIDTAKDIIIGRHFGKDPYSVNESFTGLQDFNGKYRYYATICNRYWVESDVSDTASTDKIPSFAPTIVSTYPAPGVQIPINSSISISFSKTIDTSTVASALHITPFIKFKALQWDASLKKLTILFAENLKLNTQYTLKLDSTIQDINGRYLDGNGDGHEGDSYYFVFQTLPEDLVPPHIVGSYPAIEIQNQNFDTEGIISVWFDEQLDENTVNDQSVMLYKGGTQIATKFIHQIINDKSVISIQPEDELLPTTKYTAVLDSSIKDTSGNRMENFQLIDFHTSKWHYSGITMIDDFSAPGAWWQPSGSGSTIGIDGSVTKWGYLTSMYLPNSRPHRCAFLRYKWKADPANPGYLIREYLPPTDVKNKEFDSTYVLQVYLFGDGSRNKFRFAIDEKHGGSWTQTEVSKWITIDWYGWKLVEWKLSDPNTVGTWISPDNKLNGSKYRFDSFQLTYDESYGVTYGTLYFDDFRLGKKTDTPVGIAESGTKTPKEYALEQNYPNPFNPTTTIGFQVVKSGHVSLTIYNLLGQKITTLVDKQLPAGSYKVDFDATNLTSGVYIYVLRSGNVVLSKKMTVLK